MVGGLIVVNTEQSLRRKELGTNAAAAPVQKDEAPPSSLCYQRGVGSILRPDILSVDGTIIWEEKEELGEDSRPVSTY